MSRSRASAVFAALATMMAMMVGAVALTPVAASAHQPPPPKYPPTAPRFVVNKGSVKENQTVRTSGTRYTPREKIYLTIKYPAVGNRSAFTKTVVVYASRSGTFSTNVRLISSGRVTIRARGVTSNKPTTAVVYVTRKRGHWDIHRAGFVSGVDMTPTSATLVAA
jgi:hypothetical protein